MHVKQAKIEGFSSFEDSDWVELSPHVNVIVGQNNSGKSSFLRALSGRIPNNPHRNPAKFLAGHLDEQRVLLDFRASKAEFIERLAAYGAPVRVTINGPTTNAMEKLRRKIDEHDALEIKCQVVPGTPIFNRGPTYPPDEQEDNPYVAQVEMKQGKIQISGVSGGREDSVINAFINEKDTAVFHFPSERYHFSKTSLGRHNKLDEDARNLAGFLQFLQGNHLESFDEINLRLRQVIPSVERISLDTLPDGFEILVWPAGSGNNRDLAVSLESCGTGVSQILAIFAAVVTRQNSIIIVDEINSFLHPLAVKEMLNILSNEYPTNQYVISSHSSDVISHPAISRLVVLERDGFKSIVKSFDRSDIDQLKVSLKNLGVSMMDVLGADAILWVEGPTEEIAFPNLLRDHLGGLPRGMRIASVASTGDFSKNVRSKKSVTRLYDRVLDVSAPLAHGQAFFLDREGLSDATVSEVEKETKKRLRFMSRRCIENYVINEKSISDLLSEDGEYTLPVSERDIRDALHVAAASDKVRGYRIFKEDLSDETWLKVVDGAKLLSLAFAFFSGNTYEFRKTSHTPKLLAKMERHEIRRLLDDLSERVALLSRWPV